MNNGLAQACSGFGLELGEELGDGVEKGVELGAAVGVEDADAVGLT
jgi:hypothetical protein